MATTVKEVLEETEAVTFDLTALHRCDRCGAQAFFVGLLEDCEKPLEVLLCGHHGNARQPSGKTHTKALADQGFTVLDFTHRLNEKPSVSVNAL